MKIDKGFINCRKDGYKLLSYKKKTPSITLALNLFPRGCSALGVT